MSGIEVKEEIIKPEGNEASSDCSGPSTGTKGKGTSSNWSYRLSETAYVTKIVKDKQLREYPRLHTYLESMVGSKSLIPEEVHDDYRYERLVNENKAWWYVAVVYKYIFQREIYKLKQQDPYDHQATCIEECYNDLMAKKKLGSETKATTSNMDPFHKQNLIRYVASILDSVRPLVQSYQVFKNRNNDTPNILEDVYNTSMLNMVYFEDEFLSYDCVELNDENVESILDYARKIKDLENTIVSPDLNNKYYRAYGDLILNDAIYGMKTSLKSPDESDYDEKLYQLILYSLALYIDRKKEIRKFKIYNPLLGMEYFMEIPELDFEKLLNIVKKYSPY